MVPLHPGVVVDELDHFAYRHGYINIYKVRVTMHVCTISTTSSVWLKTDSLCCTRLVIVNDE